jgi:autotransporter-associated beta strand protein
VAATTAGAISNSGTLAFNSTSSQTLAGGYSGGGALQLNGTGAVTFSNPGAVTNTASSIAAVSGSTLGIKVANTGTNVLTASNLSFAGPASMVFDFNSLANPTATLINASNVTLNGTVNITLTNATGLSSTPNNTTLALLDYDTLSGGSFNLLTTSAGHTTYALNDTGSALYLSINGLTNYWRGAASTTWDINSALGWSAPDQKYLDGDNVVFDDSATGSTSINLTANVSPTTAVFANVTKDYTITGSGGITGSEGLSKSGAGKLVIANTNSFTGATNISSGATLSLGDGTSGHDGNLTGTSGVTNSGTLEFNRFGTSTASFVISGSGGVIKNGVGTQILTSAQTYTGGTVINAGVLQLGDGTTGHDGDIAATSGVTNNGTLTFNRFGTTTSGYVISGTGAVVKDGAGTQGLKASNSYSGGTTVNAGVLVSDLSLSSPGAVTPFGTGIITVNGGQVELGVNGGAFSQYTYANDLALNGGSVFAFDGFHRLTGNISVGSGGGSLGSTFSTYYETRINGFQKGLFVDGLLSGNGNLTIQDSGYGTGNFWNVSVVYLTNPGTSSYSGTVTTGTTPGTANYLFLVGQTVLANATINVAGNNSAGAVLGTAKLLFGPGNGVDAGPTGYTLGALSGDGNVVLEETPKSTGTNVSGGGPAVILHVGGNNASTSYSGTLSGAGTLVKSGTGALTLTGASSFSGGTSIEGGTLVLSGSGRLGSGNVEVGNSSTLSLAFNDAINDGATLTIDTGGTVQVTGGVETVGTLSLGGTTFTSGTFGGVGSGADNVFSDFFAPANSGNFVSVPEPSALGLMAMGGVGLLRRRRRPVK